MSRFNVYGLCLLFQLFFVIDAAAAENLLLQYRAGLDLTYTDSAIYVFNPLNNTLTKAGDFVFEPYLNFKMERRNAHFSQKLILNVSSDIFSQYSSLNYQTYSVVFRQGIGNKASLNLKYALIPDSVLREEDISNTGQGVIDTGLNYRLQSFTLSLDKDFRQNYNIYPYVKYVSRGYGAALAYRSAFAQTGGVDLGFRFKKGTSVSGGLSYEVNHSQKGFTTPVAGAPRFDDTDYTSPGIAVSATHPLTLKDSLRFKYGFKTRHYTADPTDGLHNGRNDQMHNLVVANSFKLTPQWTWKVAYELFKRGSNKSYANDTVNSLTTGIDYLFK